MLTGTHRNSAQEQVIYGRPAVEAVAAYAESVGAKRLFLVTTRSLAESGAAALRAALGPGCVGLFSAIGAHSPRADVIACANGARAARADLLVALGGGSVIDAAKVVQLCLWGDISRSARCMMAASERTRARFGARQTSSKSSISRGN